MNGNLGRDRLWNDRIWSEIDNAVREEVGRIRVAQKVFPSSVVNNVLPVCTTRVVPFGKGEPLPDGTGVPPAVPLADQFQPFFEISSRFELTQQQVEGEQGVHLGPSRARLAATTIASAEDAIFFGGVLTIPDLEKRGIKVTNKPPKGVLPQFASIPPGFVEEAKNYDSISVVREIDDSKGKKVKVNKILAAIADGIAKLNERFQPGPYALFLPPGRYGETFQPPDFQLESPGDQINHIVTGGFYMVNSLAPDIGILVSIGGEPAQIILGTDAITAFTNIDEQGYYHFRVFERIQMVVRDGRAFQTLTFS